MSEYCIKQSKENPVAVAVGGRYDGKLFSVVKKGDEKYESDEDDDIDPLEQLDIGDFVERFRLMDLDERMRVVESIKRKEPSKYKLKLDECKTFKIDSGQFSIMPTTETERVFIGGKSGMGKSSIASMYIREYIEMFPDRRVILLSIHENEKAYAMYPNMIRIPLDINFVDNVPSLEELSNSLVIFDDCDNLNDKNLSNVIKLLNNNLIANGRKYNIHVLTLYHLLMDYSRTRQLLNEANRVVFFLGVNAYHLGRFLKVYAGLSPEQIKKITGLRSRWCCLNMAIPNYFISESEIGIL